MIPQTKKLIHFFEYTTPNTPKSTIGFVSLEEVTNENPEETVERVRKAAIEKHRELKSFTYSCWVDPENIH